MERVTDNLKAKKNECEELKNQLEEKENELTIQYQINDNLKQELEKERAKRFTNQANTKLEAENKELWEVVNQLKKEQESYKNSIFLTFKSLASNMPRQGQDVSSHFEPRLHYHEEETKQASDGLGHSQDLFPMEQPSQPMPKNKHLEAMTQEMMNNAAGSGSNQDDYIIQEKNNEGEYDEEIEYDVFDEEYNEDGTSGGNAKPLSHDKDYGRQNYDPSDSNVEADGRVYQGNKHRGRQVQSKQRKGNNMNTQDPGRDS